MSIVQWAHLLQICSYVVYGVIMDESTEISSFTPSGQHFFTLQVDIFSAILAKMGVAVNFEMNLDLLILILVSLERLFHMESKPGIIFFM